MHDRTVNFIKDFKKLDIPLHGVRLPSFKIEEKYKKEAGVKTDVSNIDFLKALMRTGFNKIKNNIPAKDHQLYRERAKYEITTLRELGFVDYILLVWDVINFCKRNDIPIGLGRGSAAGSLTLYLIGATGIDPVKHDLYFERFVSKIRAKKQEVDGITYLDGSLMCDVDIDVCYYNRKKVLEYLERKFKGKTSKILTFNTLNTKLLIKECGKIIKEKSETEMNEVTSYIPKVHGIIKDIESAYEESESFRKWSDKNTSIYKTALKLRGLAKNKGVHPSAIAISHGKLNENCPTELDSQKNSVTSFDMNWVSMSNVKLDILGLRSVSVVEDACKSIGISINDINLNEPFIYQQLQNLKTPHGLFQIEADTNFRVCQRVRPQNLEQLSAVLAIARPGALSFLNKYALYTRHEVYEPIHSFFDDILKQTGGVALYQEQLMKMANKIGFTLDEAEILRRIVGKKKVSEVRKWKKKIKDKVKENNLDPKIGDVLWQILEDSANYSFNKSHSIAYAALAAATTYLKFKHPKEFFLSLLKMTRFEPDPIAEISKIQKELDYFKIKLLPPHLIKSSLDFSIEGNNIRFGLLSIKGISEKSIDKLNDFRNTFSNKFEVFESANESGLNVGILCALIQAGALEEDFKQSRTKVVYEAQLWNLLTPREKVMALKVGKENNYDLVSLIKKLNTTKDEKGKVFIKDSRMQTIRRKCEKYKEIYEINRKSESFANWYYEKSLLGYTYGKTLQDIFSSNVDNLINLRQVSETPAGNYVAFVSTIDGKPISGVSRSAKKTKYFKVNCSDEHGSMNVLIFNDKIDECKFSNNGLPKENEIVFVKGRKMDDAVFADIITVQDNKVYTKLSELKKA